MRHRAIDLQRQHGGLIYRRSVRSLGTDPRREQAICRVFRPKPGKTTLFLPGTITETPAFRAVVGHANRPMRPRCAGVARTSRGDASEERV